MARSRPERPPRLHRPSGAIYHRLAVAAGDDRAARRHPRRPVSRAARAFGGFDGGALIFFARSHEATKIYSSVRPELVEWPFFLSTAEKEGRCFDRLRTNGLDNLCGFVASCESSEKKIAHPHRHAGRSEKRRDGKEWVVKGRAR